MRLMNVFRAQIFHPHLPPQDIKSDNIGFYLNPDEDGGADTPKLFDFGLAKEMKPQDRVHQCSFHRKTATREGDALYKLTARTGSRRYVPHLFPSETRVDLSGKRGNKPCRPT